MGMVIETELCLRLWRRSAGLYFVVNSNFKFKECAGIHSFVVSPELVHNILLLLSICSRGDGERLKCRVSSSPVVGCLVGGWWKWDSPGVPICEETMMAFVFPRFSINVIDLSLEWVDVRDSLSLLFVAGGKWEKRTFILRRLERRRILIWVVV